MADAFWLAGEQRYRFLYQIHHQHHNWCSLQDINGGRVSDRGVVLCGGHQGRNNDTIAFKCYVLTPDCLLYLAPCLPFFLISVSAQQTQKVVIKDFTSVTKRRDLACCVSFSLFNVCVCTMRVRVFYIEVIILHLIMLLS